MSPFLVYAWPGFAVGLALGMFVGTMTYRRRLGGIRRARFIAGAALASILVVAVWSGPMGGADRFATGIEHFSRLVLDNFELNEVSAHLGRGPLTRKLFLSGPADDFQRSELALTMGNVPGVSTATCARTERSLPLIVEGALAALAGLALGWFLAGLLEWHRRYNAQWNW